MNIKKKLNRYVDEMKIPEADRVLPEGVRTYPEPQEAPRRPRRWMRYWGMAGAAAVCAISLSVWGLHSRQGAFDQEENSGSGKTPETSTASKYPAGTESPSGGYMDGVIGAGPRPETNGDGYEAEDMLSGSTATSAATSAEPEGGAPGAYEDDAEVPGENAVAGTLTGGEIRDLKNWDNWLHTLQEDVLNAWNMTASQRAEVYVHNGDMSLTGVHVQLLQGQTVLYEAVTDRDGRAYLFFRYAAGNTAEPDGVQVQASDGSWMPVPYMSAANGQVMDAELAQDSPEQKVDLMYVVDTTGSMSDELEYLKAEIQDVIERAEEQAGVPIRTSVNFYRDEGDEYVVRYYDFREDAGEVAALVQGQAADGGGDEPEAVHTALQNAIREHGWADDSTVKLLFLVLDAPPHDTDEVKAELLELVEEAAARGIRIIPVAASGAGEDTQQLLRSMAVMTGGTFIFLDDNSGVGNGHSVPLKPEEYRSEYLNEMMIRIIGEYCGVEIESEPVESTAGDPGSTEFQQ